MKKIVAVLLSVAMLFALSSCAKKDDGGDKAELSKNYAAATQKTSELTAMDADVNMKMNMELAGEKMDMIRDEEAIYLPPFFFSETGCAKRLVKLLISERRMKMDVQAAPKGENDGDMAMKVSVDAQGQSMEMGMYYTEGYMYMDILGQKMKAKVDMDDAEEQMGNQTGEYLDLNPEEFMTLSMKKTGDDVVYTTTVNKDGYVTKQDIKLDCEMKIQGQTAKLSITMDMTYNNPGQAVTVEFPSFEGYTEVDASDMVSAA